MAEIVLKAEHLTKRYNDQDALYDLNFSVAEGEILAVHGPPGAGKTTLLKLAAGMLVPTSGNLAFYGKPILRGSRENAANMGVMLQDMGVYHRLTIREYLAYFQKLYTADRKHMDDLIYKAGLGDRQSHPLARCSPNICARVMMARVLLHRPRLLLLDSPTFNLEPETTEILWKMILQAAGEGAAVLLATPFQEEAHVLAGRILRLSKGRMEGLETTDNARQESGEEGCPPLEKRYKIEKIPARVKDKIILFNPTELTYIESDEGASLLHAGGETFPCPLTLVELEDKLKYLGFFRCHRSYIVNLQRVREVVPWTRNSYSLVLDDVDKSSIPLSKNAVKELETLLGI